MRENKKRWLLLTAVLLLVIPIFLAVGAFLLPEQYGETYMGELKEKQRLLAETEGKRLVFLGGSNLVFGLDSEIIEKNFPEYHAVNYGMYAALGTTVLYELAEPDLREGDLVILSPEQDSQTLSEYFNPEILWQGVDGAYSLLLRLDREKLGQMLGSLPEFAVDKWKYVLRQEKPIPEGVYRRANFNSYGDLVSEECAQNVMQNGYDENQRIVFGRTDGVVWSSEETQDEFLAVTNPWIRRLEQKGVTVLYRFAPMNRSAVVDEENVDAYYDWLARNLDCEIIGNPAHSILDAEWFYDTNFHLNNSGRILYTDQLIRDLKAMLGDTSQTEIRSVEKPEMQAVVNFRGEDSDAACFTWEERDDGIWLTGLTEAGHSAQRIVVPTYMENISVVGLQKDTFAKAENLEEIVIQANIRQLPDGLFENCRKLRRIVLEKLTPEQIAIGQELLAGTDGVKILVEELYLNQFKTDYSWGLYRRNLEASQEVLKRTITE